MRRLRLLALGYGVALWLWFSVEDNAVWPAVIFGLLVTLILLAFTFFDKLKDVWVLPALAGLAGMGTAVATAALMFFKNAMHAHVFWDFPPGLMIAILQRAFAWAAVGGLAGLGLTLLWLWLKSSFYDRKQLSQEVAEDSA